MSKKSPLLHLSTANQGNKKGYCKKPACKNLGIEPSGRNLLYLIFQNIRTSLPKQFQIGSYMWGLTIRFINILTKNQKDDRKMNCLNKTYNARCMLNC